MVSSLFLSVFYPCHFGLVAIVYPLMIQRPESSPLERYSYAYFLYDAVSLPVDITRRAFSALPLFSLCVSPPDLGVVPRSDVETP